MRRIGPERLSAERPQQVPWPIMRVLRSLLGSGRSSRHWGVSVSIGLAATALVMALAAAGLADWLERPMLDVRSRWFATATPPPSPRIVHIDIDDRSLVATQRWPWPRAMLGQVVDELDRAGAKVIAFDVLFTERQPRRPVLQGEAGAQAESSPTDPTGAIDASVDEGVPDMDTGAGDAGVAVAADDVAARRVEVIDDDRRFAEAIVRAGNVVLAVYAQPDPPNPLAERVVVLVMTEPLLDADAVVARLGLTGDDATRVRSRLPALKAEAFARLLWALAEARGRAPTLAEARAAILPDLPAYVVGSPELTLLGQQRDAVASRLELDRRLSPADIADDPVRLVTPIPPLMAAADAVGSVSYEADADGKVRSVPLWVVHDGRRVPHFALAIACAYWNIPVDDLRVSDDATIVPAGDGDGDGGDAEGQGPGDQPRRVVPMLHARGGEGWLYENHRMLVAWPTNAPRWEHLLDPQQARTVGHIPIGPIVELHRLRRRVAHNRRQADLALVNLAGHEVVGGMFGGDRRVQAFAELLHQADADAANAGPGDSPDSAGAGDPARRRAELRRYTLDQIDRLKQQFDRLLALAEADADAAAALAEEIALARAAAPALDQAIANHRAARAAADAGADQIARFEAQLAQQVDGAICLIGWTATGSLADFVPTSIDERTPGVVVHAAVLNSLLTGHFIDRAPLGVDLLIIAALGLVATAATALLPPVLALAIGLAMAFGYFVFNGWLLYDVADVWVAAAAPLLAAGLAWITITVYRLIAEQRERARITRQFKNYVSGDLVDLIVANPALIKQGRHELTCMFSDIAGFTSVSERLGPEKTIDLLNEYLRTMTHQIMAGRGTVNKYLGDGIMAFWGAPLDDDQHTLNACRSMLRCIEQMRQLQNEPRFADLPRLFMRVGIATGPMMVGDCGAPPERSDYTVIGDTVNLASRLESANKQFGTQVLLNHRTYQLVKDRMIARPVGRIRVVGKQQYEQPFELLGERGEADDETAAKCELTEAAVEAYIAGDFERAAKLFEQLDQRFGPIPLTRRYLDSCRAYLADGCGDDFDGALTLTEK